MNFRGDTRSGNASSSKQRETKYVVKYDSVIRLSSLAFTTPQTIKVVFKSSEKTRKSIALV